MRALLIGAAAMLATTSFSAPALAKDDGFAFRPDGGPTLAPDFRFGPRSGVSHPDDGGHHRRHRGDSFVYIDREYQGDTAWRQQSFNDWWHTDRARSYPAWVQRNHDCARQWWQGSVLTC